MTEAERIGDVMSVIVKYFDVTERLLRSQVRSSKVHMPRQLAIYLSHRTSGASNDEIGKAFSNRDRTIIQIHCRAIHRECLADPELMELVMELEREVRAGWRLT